MQYTKGLAEAPELTRDKNNCVNVYSVVIMTTSLWQCIWFIWWMQTNNPYDAAIMFKCLKHSDSSPGSCDECSTLPGGCQPLDQADRPT